MKASQPIKTVSPPKVASPPKNVLPPKATIPPKAISPHKAMIPPKAISPPKAMIAPKAISPPNAMTPPKAISPPKAVTPPKVKSPMQVTPPRLLSPPQVISPPSSVASPPKQNRVELQVNIIENDLPPVPTAETNGSAEAYLPPPDLLDTGKLNDETNGVGDKIKIFEKAAEDAATAGRLSRPGSVRRPRTERLPSDELPPPPVSVSPPPRIVRPEFRLASPAEVTIRSPSLGAKAPERFPSRGTAFRNVTAAPPPVDDDDFDRHKKKERHSTRGSNYFTRGSEEIWLVKKKDIEEIEERVLDSFRRARGNGAPANSNSTRGRRAYARSESLEPARPEWRAQLKRQASVACTCGHDKKARAKSVDAIRPRARSQSGDEPTSVLDKYETLV